MNLLRRIVAYPAVLLVIGFALIVATSVTVRLATRGWLPRDTPLQAIAALAGAALVIAVYKLFRRWIEGGEDCELVLAGAGRPLAQGLAIGFGLFSLMALAVTALGGLKILGIGGVGALWSALAMAIASGVFEETLFRGIVQRQIERMGGSWVALAITSAIFGFAHLMNPNATLVAGIAITVEAGLLLGAAYLVTRRLWLPIGIHAGWNFTQAWVFSAPVSGGAVKPGLLVTRLDGPVWLTGGAFGLEASLVAMVVATAAGLVMLRIAIRRGQMRRAEWRTRAVPEV